MNTQTLSPQAQDFLKLCLSHDLTYDQSDDYSVFKRGLNEYEKILRLAKDLPDVSPAIWNYAVDQQIAAPYRALYYWKGD